MAQKLNKILLGALCLFSTIGFSQEEGEGVKSPKIKDYKNDTSYTDFSSLRDGVAKAQIILLKKGALLVRLKTNSNLINEFKVAGNIDMATQMERETAITNKIVIAAYLKEFTFCPVYFFYSNTSDSVKKKNLTGIFVDATLAVNPNIICNAAFYLIAEGGQVYNSSLGFVLESNAAKAIERGNVSREVAIVIKNRYFIQLHKPFPYFQIKRSFKPALQLSNQGANIDIDTLNTQIKKIMNNSIKAKSIIGLRGCVRALNEHFEEFYQLNKDYSIPSNILSYVY